MRQRLNDLEQSRKEGPAAEQQARGSLSWPNNKSMHLHGFTSSLAKSAIPAIIFCSQSTHTQFPPSTAQTANTFASATDGLAN